MADNNGPDGSEFLANYLGALAFDTGTAAPDTGTELSVFDTVGLYGEVLSSGSYTLGDDAADYFSFISSGVGTVSISMDLRASGTYASMLYITPVSGVSKVEGDLVGTFYGGVHSYSDTRFAAAVDSGADQTLRVLNNDRTTASIDKSGATVSNSGDMSAVWTLDGDPVVFTVSGFQLNGNDIPTSSRSIDFDETAYFFDITPQDRMYSDIGNGGLLFTDIAGRTQTHQGGDAIDTYVFSGSRDDFTIDFDSGSSIGVSHANSPSTPDVLFSIERIQLDDGFLAFDIDGNAGQIFRLYQAAFDREPDVAGLGHWIDTFDRGLFDLTGVAQAFLVSEEFQLRFGTTKTLDDKAYLTLLYANVLDRTPDDAGFAFWFDQQAQGLDRADMLLHFSESEENVANVAAKIDAGIFYV